MKLLQELQMLAEADRVKVDDSELAPEVVESLKSEITSLAKEGGDFRNAMDLVHQAYDSCDVERPTPAMRNAWVEYEEMLSLAVQMLAKYQPDGDWRLTSISPESPKPVTAL